MGQTVKELLQKLTGVPIDLGGVVYPNDFAEDLSIDRSNLQEEFLTHADKYAYYATLSELAEDRFNRLKENLETVAARCDYDKRTEYERMKAQETKLKMTEKMFENEVLLDPRYQAALKEMQDARYLAQLLRNAPMAFAHRRDMLLEVAKSHTVGMTHPRIIEGQQETVRNIMQRDTTAVPPPAVEEPHNGRRLPKSRV